LWDKKGLATKEDKEHKKEIKSNEWRVAGSECLRFFIATEKVETLKKFHVILPSTFQPK